MLQGAIIIELTSGARIKYVRDILAAKSGSDGATPSNTKFAGIPEKTYMYTGAGDDEYSAQTGAGKIAGDLGILETNLYIPITTSATSYLMFPEATPTIELVRYNNDQTGGRRTYIRTKIKKIQVARIYVEESWVESPVFPESKNMLPSWAPNFRTDGWNEGKLTYTAPLASMKTLPALKIISTSSTVEAATINWQPLASDYSSYKVYLNGVLDTSGITSTTKTFTSLTKGTFYTLGIRGTTASGKDGAFADISVLTATDPVVITPTVSAYSIDLSWTSVWGASFYRVYNNSVVLSSVYGTAFTISSLLPDTTYSIDVKAANKWETNISTANASVTTSMIAPVVTFSTPSAATTTTATIVSNWTKYKPTYVYTVKRNTVTQGVADSDITTYTHTGLNADTEYTIDITAKNVSANVSPASTTLVTTAMAAPVLTIGTETEDTLPVTWVNLKTGYIYKLYKDGELIFTTAANAISYTFTGLITATEYTLTAVAVNAVAKVGPVSNSLVATTT